MLQYLAWVVQANAQRRASDTKPGPAEVALAKRLLEVVKAAGAAEATGAARAAPRRARTPVLQVQHVTSRPC